MTRIYFVRHAQPCHEVKDDRSRPLTAEGMKNTLSVTQCLKDKDINVLMSSPYKRSMDTIKDLSETLQMPIETDEDFRERNRGSWTCENFKEGISFLWSDIKNHIVPDDECISDVQSRNIAALNRVLEKYPNKNVVIATHGMALSSMLNYYDNSFRYDGFMRLVDWMPYIIELDFEGDKLVEKHEHLIIEKEFRKG